MRQSLRPSPEKGKARYVPPAIFADDFSSGDFSNWTTVTRLAIDPTSGAPDPPSARGTPKAQTAWAARVLDATYTAVCMSERVDVGSIAAGANPDLLRLRTTSDGPIMRVYATSGRELWIRSDVSGAQLDSGAKLPLGTWALIELCGTVGTSSTWTLYVDGNAVITGWIANSGTVPVGRVQIGDAAAKTWSISFDDVRLDQTPG